MPAHDLALLRAFRTDLHRCFRRRADALCELGDALLTADAVGSLPHLSLQALHRRGWGSLYAGLAEGTSDVEALRATLIQYSATDPQPVYAIDVSVWPRCDAESSPLLKVSTIIPRVTRPANPSSPVGPTSSSPG